MCITYNLFVYIFKTVLNVMWLWSQRVYDMSFYRYFWYLKTAILGIWEVLEKSLNSVLSVCYEPCPFLFFLTAQQIWCKNAKKFLGVLAYNARCPWNMHFRKFWPVNYVSAFVREYWAKYLCGIYDYLCDFSFYLTGNTDRLEAFLNNDHVSPAVKKMRVPYIDVIHLPSKYLVNYE